MLKKDAKNSPVFIDCRQLGGSGIGTYIENLIRNYSKLNPEFPIHLLAREDQTAYIRNFSSSVIKSYNDPIYSLTEQFNWFSKIDTFGLMHIPHYNAPLLYPGHLIVTVHDVCHSAMNQYFPGVLKHLYSGPFLKRILNKADQIITVSQFSKREIIKYFKIPAEKITVIYNGVSSSFKPIPPNISTEVLKKHNLPEEYILFVGNVKPHKNIKGLIASYKIAASLNPDIPPLVILGQFSDLKKDIPVAYQLLQDSTIRNKIIFTGNLPTEDLPAIYSRALLFLFPSFYEGFGLPILEAMACGCPVIASDCSSIPEVVNDSAMLIDPYDNEMIADAILRLAQDRQLQKDFQNRGWEQVKKYSWEESAKQHLDIYRNAKKRAVPSVRKIHVPEQDKLLQTKKTNILFLDQYGDRVGGGQVILLDILEKFRSSGRWNIFISVPNEGKFTDQLKKHNFDYYCVPTWKPSSFEKIPLIDMFGYVLSSVRSTFYLSQKMKEYKIDVIYCNGGRTFLNGAFLSLLFSVKIFIHLHLILENRQKRAVTILGRTPSIKSIIAVSKTLESQYKKDSIYGKLKIVSNWVSPHLFEKPTIRRSEQLPTPIRIGVVGQISTAKGQWTIIDSLKNSTEILPIQFSIYGDPLQTEHKQWEGLKANIDKLCQRGWDVEHAGFQSDTLKIYDSLDILIIPSIVPEAFGLTAIEAMSREVLVIANKSGALLEIIQHQKNGLLYNAQNPEELLILIQQIISGQIELKSIRKSGLETVKHLYHPEKQLEKLYNIVEESSK